MLLFTQYGRMTPYGDIDRGQHWPRQAITSTNVDLSSKVFGDMTAISQEMLMGLTHRGREKMAAVLQTTFSNAFS